MIPNCRSGNLASVTLNNVIAQLRTDIAATSPDMSETAATATGCIWQVDGGPFLDYRISIRSDGTNLLYMTDPGGTMATPDNPSLNASSLVSPSRILMAGVAGASTRYQFASYGDAFFFSLNSTNNTFSQHNFHFGSIALPINSNDAVTGNDGWGALCGVCGNAASQWFTSSFTAKASMLRSGPSDWIFMTSDATSFQAMQGDTIPGGQIERPDLIGLVYGKVGDAATANINVNTYYRGVNLKYVRRGLAASPLSVRPSSSTNQAWLALSFNRANSATSLKILWNKTITP